MPKRYGKAYSSRNPDFYSGFTLGKTLMNLSIMFYSFRVKKEQTLEEFAKAAGVKIAFVRGIENCDMNVFVHSDLDDFTKVALYCDVALSIQFTSLKKAALDKFGGLPKTWAEEFGPEEETA